MIEPFIAGTESTCGVLEQADGSVIALPPIEIIPAEGGLGFDYHAKYLAKATQEICPGRFSSEINAKIMDMAVRAHLALSCTRLFAHRLASSRTRDRFIWKPTPCRASPRPRSIRRS